MIALGFAVFGTASQAAAQDMPMFHNFAPQMAMVELQNEVMQRGLEDRESEGARTGPSARAASRATSLTFSPSAARRRANLAEFAAKTRGGNPESAALMEQLFASSDVIGQIGAAVAPYGYSVDNLGDAYAFWWMTAWEGARGSNRTFSRAEMRAVQAQARNALQATPELARTGDAGKQQLAEAMWIQAAMIDGMVDLAKEQPQLMPQLQRAIRQGASASGLDLDAMRLTENGFVPG
ncbi:hypothetical protein PK98_00170 [Croceibacterium mercuriale]|uniref:Uncharacterized protein n=2 Tax=Croceibacterium mercuriale TaxID=1572751 RepID=A0A0B2BUJ5_9SPHN|nr:hypothetical protein PK98_00170 [Croceibacterium mercuriale]